MQRCFKFLLPTALMVLFVFMPGEAAAQAELSPFVGYLFGSSIDPSFADVTPGILGRTFDDSFTWGVRGAYFFGEGNVGLEGNFTQAPFANFIIGSNELDARATYVDFNMIVQSTGDSARFYGTVGMGLTRFRLGASEGGQTHTKLGVNFGVGVKIPMWTHAAGGRWGLRLDVRDQWLRMDADDSMRPNFRDALLLPTNSSSGIHNVITTFAAYFVF